MQCPTSVHTRRAVRSPSLHPPRPSSPAYTLDRCKLLAAKVASAADLPLQCKQYPEAVQSAETNVNRTETSKKSAFEGMQGGLAAQANHKKGRASHAQIQRRLTNTRRFTKKKE